MNKTDYEKLLNVATNNGIEFAEIYYEETYSKSYEFSDSKLDTIKSNNSKGIGLRLIHNGEYFYASTNKLENGNLELILKKLMKNIKNKNKPKTISLNEHKEKFNEVIINHSQFSSSKKKEILKDIDNTIRNKYKEIKQVHLRFIENYKIFTIANSNGDYITSDSINTRYICHTYAEHDNQKEDEVFVFGRGKGYEFLNDIDIKKESIETAQSTIEKLHAENFKGGEVPVIINRGFGAVIFHEACGHGLEATSIAPKLSIFTGKLGQKVGSDKVTLIDDGTIKGAWGSNFFDSEGQKTQKNILIEKGILKNFLIDKYSTTKMNMSSNGCSRRQNYEYAPTSRMSNTYLAPGIDKIVDMIKSIDYGIYCKKLSGGQVNTTTGDFNFGVDTAYLIENGEITKRVKGLTLIGNGKDILNNIEMVSNDLELGDGYCGSKSGMIPVTCGQPTIKVSKMLVGGKE